MHIIKLGSNKKYYFRNKEECVSFINSILNNNNLLEICDFHKNCSKQLEHLLQNSHPNELANFQKTARLCFKIGNQAFKDVKDFEKFFLKLSSKEKDKYLEINQEDIFSIIDNNPQLKRSLEKKCKIYQTSKLEELDIGEDICFGQFNGEVIYWTVIKKTRNYYFVVARDPIFDDCYSNYSFSLWRFSHLRKYLNNYFFANAFSHDQQLHICKKRRGLFLRDRLFLLTLTEAKKAHKYSANSSDFNSYWIHLSFGIKSLFFILITAIFNILKISMYPIFILGIIGLGALFLYLANLMFNLMIGFSGLLSTLVMIVLVLLGVLVAYYGIYTFFRNVLLGYIGMLILFVYHFFVYLYRYLLGVTVVDSTCKTESYSTSYSLPTESRFSKEFIGLGDVTEISLNDTYNVRPGMYLKRNIKL